MFKKVILSILGIGLVLLVGKKKSNKANPDEISEMSRIVPAVETGGPETGIDSPEKVLDEAQAGEIVATWTLLNPP